MAAFIEHPRLSQGAVEARGYQIEAVADCLATPTLLVLPTALGKTPVEWMVIAERLRVVGGKALLVAPTNALIDQHHRDLMEVMVREENGPEIVAMNGSIVWKKRQRIWKTAEIIVATPQVIRNDVQRGSIDLTNVSILVIDEGHHSKGRNAVAELGELYRQLAANPLILAATASPGSTKEDVSAVCKRLGVKRIHSRTADDAMLAPYAAGLRVREELVKVDEGLKVMVGPLQLWLDMLVEQLRRLGYHAHSGPLTSRQLNETRGRIQLAINKGEGLAFGAARKAAQAQRLLNLIGYLLSQGVAATREYLKRTKATAEEGDKGASAFIQDPRIEQLIEVLRESPELHEKVQRTVDLTLDQLEEDAESRVIVFAHFRDTVDEITRRLSDSHPAKPVRFVGQTTRKGSVGMSQKKQVEVLNRFRDGEFNVLVATSVGEEGLDVPRADRVIFYEPVGSEIRNIQRRGRTGRHRSGSVFVLIARDTRDEGARASALSREKRMQKAIAQARREMGRPLDDDPKEYLQAFRVRTESAVGTAHSFMEAEKKRLAPALGEKESRIERVREVDARGDNTTHHDRAEPLNPARLRPQGQTGLESFPSVAAKAKQDEQLGDEVPASTSDGEELEKRREQVSIQAAEDIVQALTTIARDPLAAETESLCRIVVDHREMNTTIAATLRLQGIDVDVQTLSVGDFQIGDRVLIERKRVRDFVDSLLDGRLLEQANRLVAAAPRPLLLIEGSGLLSQRAVHHNALMGALATLTIDLGLPVVTTQNGEETARFLIVSARREQALAGALTSAARARMERVEIGQGN